MTIEPLEALRAAYHRVPPGGTADDTKMSRLGPPGLIGPPRGGLRDGDHAGGPEARLQRPCRSCDRGPPADRGLFACRGAAARGRTARGTTGRPTIPGRGLQGFVINGLFCHDFQGGRFLTKILSFARGRKTKRPPSAIISRSMKTTRPAVQILPTGACAAGRGRALAPWTRSTFLPNGGQDQREGPPITEDHGHDSRGPRSRFTDLAWT